MVCENTKLVYSDGMPLWLTPEGCLLPVVRSEDGTIRGADLYIKDRSGAVNRLSA